VAVLDRLRDVEVFSPELELSRKNLIEEYPDSFRQELQKMKHNHFNLSRHSIPCMLVEVSRLEALLKEMTGLHPAQRLLLNSSIDSEQQLYINIDTANYTHHKEMEDMTKRLIQLGNEKIALNNFINEQERKNKSYRSSTDEQKKAGISFEIETINEAIQSQNTSVRDTLISLTQLQKDYEHNKAVIPGSSPLELSFLQSKGFVSLHHLQVRINTVNDSYWQISKEFPTLQYYFDTNHDISSIKDAIGLFQSWQSQIELKAALDEFENMEDQLLDYLATFSTFLKNQIVHFIKKASDSSLASSELEKTCEKLKRRIRQLILFDQDILPLLQHADNRTSDLSIKLFLATSVVEEINQLAKTLAKDYRMALNGRNLSKADELSHMVQAWSLLDMLSPPFPPGCCEKVVEFKNTFVEMEKELAKLYASEENEVNALIGNGDGMKLCNLVKRFLPSSIQRENNVKRLEQIRRKVIELLPDSLTQYIETSLRKLSDLEGQSEEEIKASAKDIEKSVNFLSELTKCKYDLLELSSNVLDLSCLDGFAFNIDQTVIALGSLLLNQLDERIATIQLTSAFSSYSILRSIPRELPSTFALASSQARIQFKTAEEMWKGLVGNLTGRYENRSISSCVGLRSKAALQDLKIIDQTRYKAFSTFLANLFISKIDNSPSCNSISKLNTLHMDADYCLLDDEFLYEVKKTINKSLEGAALNISSDKTEMNKAFQLDDSSYDNIFKLAALYRRLKVDSCSVFFDFHNTID